MKILFFIESLRSGGKERRLVELIKGLSDIPTIEMELVLTKGIIHYNEIKLLNVRIHYTIRKKGLKKDPKVFYSFYKIAQKYRPDIIHVWGNLVAIYAIPAKYMLGIPMINNQITDAPGIVSKTILRHNLSFLFSDKIISNSYAGLNVYKVSNKKSLVIYNGFDFKRIENLRSTKLIRKRFNISTKFIIGMVASFNEKKDYSSFIQSANIILKTHKNVSFLCVGSGDYSEIEQIVEMKNRNKIYFLGKQDNVEDIMNICDIGVLLTNVNKHGEGISNALLEFMALGKPVVANLNGGNSELIEHGKTGYLIKQGTPIELSRIINSLLNDKNTRLNLGKEAKNKVINEFSLENMIFKFLNLYKNTLGLK